MTNLQKEINLDKAWMLLRGATDSLEATLGECNDIDTVHEGRINFKFKAYFANDDNKVTTKKIEVCISNGYVKVLKR
jgi:hypothetical protein